jgi:hypothetical protein
VRIWLYVTVFATFSGDPENMIHASVTALILVFCFNEEREVKLLSGYSAIVINGCVAIVFDVNKKIFG